MKKRLSCALTLLAAGAFARDQESSNAHFQSAYVRQARPAFASPRTGPLSLLEN